MSLLVRDVDPADHDRWIPLWNGYNAFYGREDGTALDPSITRATWARFLDPAEPVFALVADDAGRLVGIAHYLFHRSTTRLEPVCYLQDLFTLASERGRGIGRALIETVYRRAQVAGVGRVYWQTHEANAAGRRLYDTVGKHHGFIVYAHDV